MTTDKNEIRQQLLENGYRPLPLVDKGIRIKGWSRATLDQAWVDQYKRSGNFPNTGIRCDDLIAFDIDVLDEDLSNQCEDLINDYCGYSELCRVGQWPKRLLLYRLDGEILRSARTGKYGGHQVELLATHGRQFAAFGIHPGTHKEYNWLDSRSPVNTPYTNLLPITADHAIETLNRLDQLLIDTGLERTAPGGGQSAQGINEYDLVDEFPVLIHDDCEGTWGDLKDNLDAKGVWGNLKRENGEWGDSNAVHFYMAHGSGQCCAHDFARDVTHWEPTVSEKLGEALPDEPEVDMFTDQALADMLQDYVLLADKTVRHIDHPEESFSFDGFKLVNSHLRVPAPTKKEPFKTIHAVDAWKAHPSTLRADKASLRPDAPGSVMVRDGKLRVFNTYNPPEHSAKGGSIDVLLEFIEHLIPDAVERDIFLDWHALKVANPSWRMHGLVMVTPEFGTGRGTWFQILERLFGMAYVSRSALSELVGEGSQGQFNDYMATSLLVTVAEALEEKADSGKWQTRHIGYERLKLICDTVAERMHIKRKYGRNSHEMVYASIEIATNHVDAFAIVPGDRRLTVLSNGEVPLVQAEGDLYGRIHAWKDSAANVAALYRYLVQRAASAQYDPFGMPPMTPAKTVMVEEGKSDLDRLYDDYVEAAKGDICTHAQWRRFAYDARLKTDYDFPVGDAFDRGIGSIIQRRARRFTEKKNVVIKIGGATIRPFILRNFMSYKGLQSNSAIREEILLNGDPGGKVAEFPQKGK